MNQPKSFLDAINEGHQTEHVRRKDEHLKAKNYTKAGMGPGTYEQVPNKLIRIQPQDFQCFGSFTER